MRTALQLIAHGSRRAEANTDLQYFAEEIRRRGLYPVVMASFLELADPSIEDGAAKCVAEGADRVVLLPFFLSAGVHVQRDLVDARARLSARFPHVDFRLADPIGRHPLLLQIVEARAREAERA
jgi:sirohydrochlorin ferrochelatase